GNTAANTGAGIFYNRGTLTLTNVTVSDNTGSGVGCFSTAASLRSCTIAGNSGVGLDASVKTALRNSIIAGNSGGSGAECGGTIDSAGYNLIQNVACTIMGDSTGNIIGQDPMLGALDNNDGPTMTRALPPGSPAVDKANPAAPGSGGNACEEADQRGTTRP